MDTEATTPPTRLTARTHDMSDTLVRLALILAFGGMCTTTVNAAFEAGRSQQPDSSSPVLALFFAFISVAVYITLLVGGENAVALLDELKAFRWALAFFAILAPVFLVMVVFWRWWPIVVMTVAAGCMSLTLKLIPKLVPSIKRRVYDAKV